MRKELKLLKNDPDIWKQLPDTFAELLSCGRWRSYNYLEYISNKIVDAIYEENGRVIVSLPPRHGKSEFVSKWVPVWFLSMWPEKNVILTTYETDFAVHWGRNVRNIIQERKDLLGINISQDSSSAARWNTTMGGGMVCAGVGGPVTGRGGNFIIIDDPHKNYQEVHSAKVRKNIINWFNSTLYTRCEPGATIVLLQTRWHQGDLAGYLVQDHADNWKNIVIPAIAENDDILGRVPGMALCEERYNSDQLLKIKESLGSYLWSALYQQRPVPEGGGIFKIDWWRYYLEAPDEEMVVCSWDTAFKKGQYSDFSVGQAWAITKTGYYLLDQVREKLEYTDLKRMIVSMYEKWNPSKVLIEDKASGQSVVQELKRSTRIPIIPINPGNDKVTRAQIISPMIEAGRVFLPEKKKWLHDFLDEANNFPNSDHDDQVDAMSQALNYMNRPKRPNIRFI